MTIGTQSRKHVFVEKPYCPGKKCTNGHYKWDDDKAIKLLLLL